MTSWGSLVAAVGRANLSQNEALERRRSAQKNQQSDQVQGPPSEGLLPCKWAYLQNRNRSTDLENKFKVTKRGNGGCG